MPKKKIHKPFQKLIYDAILGKPSFSLNVNPSESIIK